MALKPSKVFVTPSSARMNCLRAMDMSGRFAGSGHVGLGRSLNLGTGAAVWLFQKTPFKASQLCGQPDDSLRHEQRHENKEPAEDIGPLLGEGVSGVALEGVAADGAEDGTKQIAASTHGAPDHGLKRLVRRHFARI